MRLTFVQSETDNGTAWKQDWPWDDVAEFLTTHQRQATKGELGVIFARFVDGPCRRRARTGKCTEHCPGNNHRIDENVDTVTALGLDFDDAPRERLEQLITKLRTAQLRHLWYTTWSSTPEQPKIRIVIALDAEVPAAQFRGFWDAVVDGLGIRDIVDTKCRNPGRLFFTPQCAEGAQPFAAAVVGTPLAVAGILARVPPDPTPSVSDGTQSYPPASPALIQHALGRLAAMGPAIAGQGGNAHARAAWGVLVNDLALSRAEAAAVFRVWDLNNQPPWGEEAFAGPCREDQAWSNPRGTERERFETAERGENIFGEAPPAPPEPETYGRPLLEYLGADDPGDVDDEWIQHGLIAAGVAQTTAGHPKSYKTFLMEYLFVCSALGVEAFQKFPVKRTRGLILPREDSERETRRRVWRLFRGIAHQQGWSADETRARLRELEGWLWIESLKPFYWAVDDDMRALLQTIERRKLGMVLVDSLSRTHLGDENSVKEMQPVINRWADTAQQFGVAVSVIHHFTKSGSGTLLQQLRGSGSIGAAVRHIVGVEKPKERGQPFEIDFDGNLRGLPAPFKIQIEDGKNAAGQEIITFSHKGGMAQPTDVTQLRSMQNYEAIFCVMRALLTHEERKPDNLPQYLLAGADGDRGVRHHAGIAAKACREAIADAKKLGIVMDAEPIGVKLTDVGSATIKHLLAPR